MVAITNSPPNQEGSWADVAPVLDLEIERLSADLRITVILCDVEGKTRKEAARQLGWPEGTVSSRLMKARSLLAKRLTRHGVTLSVAALGVLLAQNAATAAVPGTLVTATLTAASTVSIANTTTAGTLFGKFIGMIKGSYQAVLLSKGALAAVTGAAIVTMVLALQPRQKEPEPIAVPAAAIQVADNSSLRDDFQAVLLRNTKLLDTCQVEWQLRVCVLGS